MAKPSTADRLASRLDRKALHRRAMPGGGEVFTGEVATRSLKALGARAMTVDNSIIVSDDFDPSNVQDQALYAHEQFHLQNSGGGGAHTGHDGEEIAARAVERMVLHRANGHSTSQEYDQVFENAKKAPGPGGPQKMRGKKQEEDKSASKRGYVALLGQGLTHPDVVGKLAREVLEMIDAGRDLRFERMGDKRGFL
ncbi:MAG: eCIS core domain-containing protein [Myxococcota bacterium]